MTLHIIYNIIKCGIITSFAMKYTGYIKILFLVLLILLAVVYLSIYICVPYFLNKNDYSRVFTDIIKEQTGLIFITDNYKIKMSPKLDICLTTGNTALFYPDKKQILGINQSEINISTIYLLKKEIKISAIKANNFQFTTKILNNGKTSLQEYLEKHTKQNKNLFKFSQDIPSIFVNDYVIKIKDEKTGKKLKFTGKKFVASHNIDPRYIDISTAGSFYCIDSEFLKYKLKIAIPKVILKDFNNYFRTIHFDNLGNQQFKAAIDSNIKVHTKNNKFSYISGKTDIDDFSIKIGDKYLPPSYFHMTLDKGYAGITSKFYTNKNEITNIKANIKLTRPYSIVMKCNCPKADLQNLQKLAAALLEMLKIKNNLYDFKTYGTISADFSISSDLKKLKSNGKLVISSGKIIHKDVPFDITNVNAFIDFSNNYIKINRSSALVNNQPVRITGTVKPDATGSILISADNLDLKYLLKAFPVLKTNNNFVINSGKLSFSARLNGKLLEAKPQINAIIDDISGFDKLHKIKFSVKNIKTDAVLRKEVLSGAIVLQKLQFKLPDLPDNLNIVNSDKVSIKFGSNNLIVNDSKFSTGKAKAIIAANISNYSEKPDIKLLARGTLDTNILKHLISDKNSLSLYNKGYLPFTLDFRTQNNILFGDLKILANSSNYITPIIVNSFKSTNTLTHIKLRSDLKDVQINDISVYLAPGVNSLVRSVNLLKLKKTITISGTIRDVFSKNPKLENIKADTLNNINVSLPVLKDAAADIKLNIKADGDISKPSVKGNINVSNLKIPKSNIYIPQTVLILQGNQINLKIDNINAANSNISFEAVLEPDFLITNKIKYLKFTSPYMDMNYIPQLMELFNKSQYTSGIDFPYTIEDGSVSVKSFKIDNIKAQNISSKLEIKDNILYLSQLYASAYGGKIAGNIEYNLPYSIIKAKIQGRGLNALAATSDLMPKDMQLTGKLNLDADVSMFTTYSQQILKSIKGNAEIVVNNGHLGQFGRFEHFLYAQNLLSQRLINASLNSAKQAISPQDTGYFTYLKGNVKLNNGYAYFSPILTSGPKMSLYIIGNFNLLNYYADLQILGKISSEISSNLGLLGSMTIKDFLDDHTKVQVKSNVLNYYNIELPEADISKIPALSPDLKYQTKAFRVLINGATNSVKSVKSFTWVNPVGTKKRVLNEMAQKAINQNSPDKQENKFNPINNGENIQNLQTPVNISPNVKQTTPSFLDNIPDDFN